MMNVLEEPLISIIVPIYKVEKYLKECVDSILAQTYQNFELILVDDGSPDSCPAMCDEFAKQDSRVVVIHKENGGLSDARNAGLDIAKGEYIGFVDSDDYISPIMYETLLNRILSDKSELAVCEYVRVYDSDEREKSEKTLQKTRKRCYSPDEFFSEVFLKCSGAYVVAVNKLYHKNIFRKLRFPVGKQHEDEFIIHRVIAQCKNISYIEDELYYYFQREGSIMNRTFNVRNLDYGDALIDRYHFTKRNKYEEWKNDTVCRLSSQLEKWNKYAKDNIEIRKKYNELRKKSWFLVFEKKAFISYNSHGRLYMKFQLIMPKLAESMNKLYNKIRKR